jgi:hypothetical protein
MDLQVPISLDVVGVPFRIFGSQLCEKLDDTDIGRLEFGTRLTGDVVCKSFQFENQSPVEINAVFSVDGDEFIITPASLCLAPFQNSIVKVEYTNQFSGVSTPLASCIANYVQQGVDMSATHGLVSLSARSVEPKISIDGMDTGTIYLDKRGNGWKKTIMVRNECDITCEVEVWASEGVGLSGGGRLSLTKGEESEVCVETEREGAYEIRVRLRNGEVVFGVVSI